MVPIRTRLCSPAAVLLLPLLLLGAGPAAAQSNVRPAPRIVRVPEMGAELLRPPVSVPASRGPWARRWEERPASRFASTVEDLAEVEEAPDREGFAHLALEAVVLDNAEFERGGGDVAISRGGWSGVFGEKVGEEMVLAVSIDAEASFYDFSGAQALMGGALDPFNDVYDSRLGLTVLADPAERRTWFAGIELGLSGEDDADLRDAFTVGGVGGMRVRLGAGSGLSLGVAVRSRLEDDPWVIPYLGFDIRLGERLELRSEGSRVSAVLAASSRVDLSLAAEYAIRQFRLNDDSPLPAGVVQDEEIRAGAGLAWHASDSVSLEVEGGVTLWRELTSFAENGGRIAEVETETAPFAALRLSVAF